MEKIEEKYRKQKKLYKIFHVMLNVVRIISITILLAFFTYLIIYTIRQQNGNNNEELFFKIREYTKIIIPLTVGIWILWRLLDVLFHIHLKKLKERTQVIDEI